MQLLPLLFFEQWRRSGDLQGLSLKEGGQQPPQPNRPWPIAFNQPLAPNYHASCTIRHEQCQCVRFSNLTEVFANGFFQVLFSIHSCQDQPTHGSTSQPSAHPLPSGHHCWPQSMVARARSSVWLFLRYPFHLRPAWHMLAWWWRQERSLFLPETPVM